MTRLFWPVVLGLSIAWSLAHLSSDLVTQLIVVLGASR